MKTFYESVIIYSTKPLKRSFESKYLKMLPSSVGGGIKPFPLRVQFQIESNEPYFRFSNGTHDLLTKKILEIEQLLSLFTQYYFYGFRKRKNVIKQYSKEKYEKANYGKIKWYQDLSLDDRNVDEVIFPDNIEMLFQAYEKIDETKKTIFRKALLLYYRAIELKHVYPSFSFLSFVSSIETLCQIEYKNEDKQINERGCCHTVVESPWKCETCGSPLWGISKKYRIFLTKYCFGNEPTEIDNKFLSEVYSVRSKIVHAGKMLLVDDFWSEENVDWNQSFLHKELLAYTRVAINNWLLVNGLT